MKEQSHWRRDCKLGFTRTRRLKYELIQIRSFMIVFLRMDTETIVSS